MSKSLNINGDHQRERATSLLTDKSICNRPELSTKNINLSGPNETLFAEAIISSAPFSSELCVLIDGGFVLTWSPDHGGDDHTEIYAQRYDAGSKPVGSQIQVNTISEGLQSKPSVSSLCDGGYVITWTCTSPLFHLFNDIFAQRFDSKGRALGSEFIVNKYVNVSHEQGVLASLSKGGFVVVYSSNTLDRTGSGVAAQIYDSCSNPIGGGFWVSKATSRSRSDASVAGLVDGGFVVVYLSEDPYGEGSGVTAKTYDENGSVIRAEFWVNSSSLKPISAPSVVGLANGGFFISWVSLGSENAQCVYGQLYDSNGERVGFELQVSSELGNFKDAPKVTALDDGGFIVVWQSVNPHDLSILMTGRRFNESGSAKTDEFQITKFCLGEYHHQVDVAFFHDRSDDTDISS